MKFDKLYAQEGISALDSHLSLWWWWWQRVIMQKCDVLTTLLNLVSRLRFIQSYTVTPTAREKNRRVKDELQPKRSYDSMPQQQQLPQQPGTQRIHQWEILLCKVLTCRNQTKALRSVCQGGYTELPLVKLQQSLSVPFSKERCIWPLCKVPCCSVSASLCCHSGQEVECPRTPWSRVWSYSPTAILPLLPSGLHIPHHFFLASINQVTTDEQFFSGWFTTVRCFLSDQIQEAL